MNTNLPEDTSLSIDQWCKDCAKRHRDDRCKSKDPHLNELEGRTPYPHMNKGVDSVDDRPNECKNETDKDDEEMVD